MAASSLPRLDRCADESALVVLDRPDDEASRRELADIDALIARGEQQLVLKRAREGVELAETAVERAQALGQERAKLEAVVNTILELEQGVTDHSDLLEIAVEVNDADSDASTSKTEPFRHGGRHAIRH